MQISVKNFLFFSMVYPHISVLWSKWYNITIAGLGSITELKNPKTHFTDLYCWENLLLSHFFLLFVNLKSTFCLRMKLEKIKSDIKMASSNEVFSSSSVNATKGKYTASALIIILINAVILVINIFYITIFLFIFAYQEYYIPIYLNISKKSVFAICRILLTKTMYILPFYDSVKFSTFLP